MLFFFEKIKNCFFLYVPFLIFQGLVIQRPIIISTNPGLVQLSLSLHSRDLFGIIFNCSQMVSRFWDIQSVGISKNATDNQRLQSVILTYTIYNLFSNFIYTTAITNGTVLDPTGGGSFKRSWLFHYFRNYLQFIQKTWKGESCMVLFWAWHVNSLMGYLPVRDAYVEHSCSSDACDSEYLHW